MTIHYTITGTAKRYTDVPEGARVTTVNGRDVIGRCESCERYIFDRLDDAPAYHSWEDGVMTCLKCGGPETER